MKYSKEEIQTVVYDSMCYADCLRKMGLVTRGKNFETIRNYINYYKIDITHFDRRHNVNKAIKKNLLEDILSNKVFCSTGNLKLRLYSSGLKERYCEECGQSEIWRGKKISLILDHKDGNNKNNSLDNLRILCPNCNSTLETHCGKNVKRVTKYCKCGNERAKTRKQCNKCIEVKNSISETRTTELKRIVEKSGVDFSKFGWVNHVAVILNIKPQKVNQWMKKYMFEFYTDKCFKRKKCSIA